jgi:hypothetical protein
MTCPSLVSEFRQTQQGDNADDDGGFPNRHIQKAVTDRVTAFNA